MTPQQSPGLVQDLELRRVGQSGDRRARSARGTAPGPRGYQQSDARQTGRRTGDTASAASRRSSPSARRGTLEVGPVTWVASPMPARRSPRRAADRASLQRRRVMLSRRLTRRTRVPRGVHEPGEQGRRPSAGTRQAVATAGEIGSSTPFDPRVHCDGASDSAKASDDSLADSHTVLLGRRSRNLKRRTSAAGSSARFRASQDRLAAVPRLRCRMALHRIYGA